MIWIEFKEYYIVAILLWFLAILFLWVPTKNNNIALLFAILGALTVVLFTVLLWLELDRPPMRTLGETRLWYSLFLPFIGIFMFFRWKYKWFLSYSLIMASIFLTINLIHPETYSKSLMPALQSYWFIPHVVVYMFAYATLAMSMMVAIKGLVDEKNNVKALSLADNLVYIGFSFLSFGLIFGALWAKKAWGHYWTWDPKEIWAFLTWIAYLIYIHIRINSIFTVRKTLWLLSISFIVLLVCWFGVKYLPIANYSIHNYTN